MAEPSFAHVACCIDDSAAATRALAHADALRTLAGGKLTVLHVMPSPAFLTTLAAGLGGAPVHDSELEREAAEMWLAEQIHGRGNAEAVLLEGHPSEAAVDWAREAGCDVLVAARHSGRVERVLVGSFARHLVDHAPCPVLLIPPAEAG
ncbi:MAG TPA: universal stress protein [Miltoncostaeaceae bacterium]|jgi:nucleotide-binding universal stress UspA family protein|nr:universal stress protein [Miltoncostaeaceae bacterium]